MPRRASTSSSWRRLIPCRGCGRFTKTRIGGASRSVAPPFAEKRFDLVARGRRRLRSQARYGDRGGGIGETQGRFQGHLLAQRNAQRGVERVARGGRVHGLHFE